MKKIILFIILILIIISYNKENKIQTFSLLNNSYNYYNFKTDLTTNNILNHVDNIKIVSISTNNFTYLFNNNSNEYNIKSFTNKYKQNLINNNNFIDSALIKVNGIKINTVCIYTNNLNQILNNNHFTKINL